MGREYVKPGVPNRARTKFGGCCGCCRTFIDRFGSSSINTRRPLGEVGNGWIVGNGDCSIQNLSGVKKLVMSGPDAMLVRDMRNENFNAMFSTSRSMPGFTTGPFIPDEGNIIFNPEKEYRFLFNWVDSNNFDFISYWDHPTLTDYTLSKVGSRVNGSEEFFMPSREGSQMINSWTYTLRSEPRIFSYMDGMIFINSAENSINYEQYSAAFPYRKPQASKFCGFGTGPEYVGEYTSTYFLVTKTAPFERGPIPISAFNFDWDLDCKWPPPPNSGCNGFVMPTYVNAEFFNALGVSQGEVRLLTNPIYGSPLQRYYTGGIEDDIFNGIYQLTLSVSPSGTIDLNGVSFLYTYRWTLESEAPRDDCNSWSQLEIPAGETQPFSPPSEGHWEITGVYEDE